VKVALMISYVVMISTIDETLIIAVVMNPFFLSSLVILPP
jgi:hypothetical protein